MQMNWKKKAAVAAGVLVLLVAAGFMVVRSRGKTVTVATARAQRQHLVAVVTASGEIKPRTYVNVGANAYGKIVKLYVAEGDQVRRGQLLAQLENVQPGAEVAAMQAALTASRGDALAAEAGLRTARAELARAEADGEKLRLDYERAQQLFGAQLISKAEYDQRKAAYESAAAGLSEAKARLAQAEAQQEAARGRVKQAEATLTRVSDQLSKTTYEAPFDGIVTNVPVREGEMVVMGIQNSPGSTLMTIADMGVITAEVKVDETDIVRVKMGQEAEVKVDALPGQSFRGRVTEIGHNAIVRSTGVSTSQTLAATQEAKDFKVVVTLEDPPANLRPGLSATAKITTDTRENALVIPIQALTVRQRGDLENKEGEDKASVQAAGPRQPDDPKEELQGVFVVRNGRAQFVPAKTGIMGAIEIEVLEGVKEGDEVVSGSYKVLRTLENGARVKVDNSGKNNEEKP